MGSRRSQAAPRCEVLGCLAATALGFAASASGGPGGYGGPFVAIGIGSLVASFCIGHAWARFPDRLREAGWASGALAVVAVCPALFW